MNKNFEYPFWFERCSDGISWAFTLSGNEDDEKNLEVTELNILFKTFSNNFWVGMSNYKEFADSIIGVGVCYNGEADFHFSDGTVSNSTAYIKDTHEFLELINLFCIGYLKVIQNHDDSIKKWFQEYENYHSVI